MTISTLSNETTKSGSCSGQGKNGGKDFTYGKKCFTKEEWKEQVAKYSAMGELYANKTIHYPLKIQPNSSGGSQDEGFATIQTTPIEPTLPRLLLNYFVSMAYEDSSIRMAKELGFIRNNKDIAVFNDLYKIKERFHIKHLIKLGRINEAMEEINSIFGLEVLEETFNATGSYTGRTDRQQQQQQQQFDIDGDLHFKLLLLNLIEMIRSHHQQENITKDSNDFILNLIQYSQNKLAIKASSSVKKMQELELAMTLLLFPLSDSADSDSIKLPKSLQNLYSISLRSKIADLVNEKLLKFIHPRIQFEISNNNSKFPDLLNSDKKIITQNFTVYNNNLVNGSNGTKITHISSDQPINEKMSSNEVTAAANSVWLNQRDGNVGTGSAATTFHNLENKNYWNQTSELLSSSNGKEKGLEFNNYYSSEFPYEPRLTQIMKLWCWCENQLHHNQIGVPRVEN
ncbi:BPK_HP2_G0039830.mRNA.1.CDS.1 [Saccharomyces cerevisiae]|uniref:Gid8p n=2 Tax=Saccharomyces cerevisiae TaxID=4932 RepID=C8ZEZ0_YEAS8|nr:Gid8p [Saccharomyces cerevisiae YJM244]AJS69865.1 Gid8p [Saccharomyces cerevisiae YJM627]AJS76864.1 Gid8p [Saccharomyces cerevisiae YJM1129]AJS86006.1 Gid8p [Saccharomyces cerevisiae YJM1355]AJS88618.1 Gid8p [Saccharomyces cerevisiae YJM1387]AJS98638.1 Gid8p [Saccharomyces cerevisiae YJM1526]AJT00391.1 Gid8p [Saccharomyces cerevisiae YJM1574]EDV11626.1 glucose-induced degradation protein 8 [Saccharomyces cerevisiae RM11-1a]EWH16741.1 Gid8p [Saccharomyces cerevisiae P283]CAD6483141.1 Y55